jgi:amino acid adenylation domain-containing protein
MSLLSLERHDVFPLSAAQERLWYTHALNSDSDEYNVPIALDIRNHVNVAALSQALHRVLARHDNMRAVFTERNSKPVQFIRPASGLTDWLRIVDLRGMGPEKEMVAKRLQALESTATFKLDSAPLLRVTLLWLEAERCVILLSSHHIVSDGASLRILLGEVATAYERYARGEHDGLTPLRHQYADYVSWESRYLSSPDAGKSAEFWKQYLSGAPANIGLPTDYRRAAAPHYSGRQCEHRLGHEVCRKVRLHARRAQCSEFMLMLAALGALIHRYTGNADLVISTPTEGRHLPEWSQLIGFFVNMLPMRIGVQDRTTFDDLLQATRDSALRVLEHAKYPFINILKDSKLNRNVRGTPYCDVVFQKIDALRSALASSLLTWSDISTPGNTAKFNMLLNAIDDGRSIALVCEYNSRLYSEERIRRFLEHYETLLDQALTDPTAEIAAYRMLDEGEHREIINAWNRTAATLPAAADVCSVIEAQARSTPDRIAVVDADEHVSYGRLMARVDALAERLSASTDQSEFVGVMLERSIRFVIAILAINRIGKAFVPIDASLPESRIDYILRDAGITVLITSRHLKARAAARAGIGTIVCLDQLEADATVAAPGKADPEHRALFRKNAYCLYTSGSTGAPKGVVISQTALCNYLWWAGERYRLGNAVMGLHSSLSADLTVTSILGPLLSGGTTRVYQDAQGDNLLEQILRENLVDVLKVTPTHLAQLDFGSAAARRLRTLIVGGERLPQSLAARTREILNPDLTIYNEYGPTEATVGCVVYEQRGDEQSAKSVPIGRPIANMEAYVLDARLNPVPRGVQGEIYLSGVGLAMGYHNRPSLTAEKFLPNPFRARQRMYRTGDIGVLHFNGEMEFSHRNDRQIKVRGYRVELKEIEAALAEHEEIASCVVEVRSVAAGAHRSSHVRYCAKSGLASDTPGAEFDAGNVSRIARRFDDFGARARAFFKSAAEFRGIVNERIKQKTGKYDCIVLASGGKDSMYVLHQVARMGYKVLAFTLDNGYLSKRALTNIKIGVEALQVDWDVASPANMNAIFVDSLRRYSNVCNGCFKALYTASFNLARQKGVPVIVSGLSRGQLFETRLAANFEAGCFDVPTIERNILDARVAYHQVSDAVSKYMDTSVFADRGIFSEVEVIDFYRYVDVTEKEIYTFLKNDTDWIVPEDTGRSTNCLINDVGIHVHKLTRGYHNYSVPYAYDVLLGHKEREETVNELSHNIDVTAVKEIIRDIGFEEEYERIGEESERIVGYYVAKAELSPSRLRRFLESRLSEYMIPAAFVRLDSLPLTSSGKLDRARLPAVDRARPELLVRYVPPGSAIEEEVAAIWSRLLYVDEPGMEDDFFELGGHSLLAFDLVRRIAEIFKVEIDLNTVVANSTIGSLARIIENAKRSEESHGLPQIVPDSDHAHDPFPLTDTQEAYWVGRKATFDMGNVALHGYLEVTCTHLDIHRLEQAWTKLVVRHGMLRAIIQEDATQRILPDVHGEPFPIVDLRGIPAAAFDAIVERIRDGMSHEIRPLDRWPLFDFRIVLKSDDEACLLMSLEVMNVDESSFLILSDELGQLYRKPDTVMAPLAISFRDYVLGQRDLVPPAVIEKSWEYWNAVLDELPPGPELPTAISLKEVAAPRFTRRTFRIDPARWDAVQRFARAIKVTPSGVLLAAYAEILARWSNRSQFTINIPVYNRLPLHPKVNDLVGVFTAINLLVVEVPPNAGFAQRAVQIQQRLWRDLDHRFISGVKLLREIGRRRGANAEAAFPYVFTNIMGLGRSGKTSGLESLGTITYGISQTPQVLIDCQLAEEAGGLYACWDSVDEVFPPGMLDEMFRAFEGVVDALSSGREDIDALIDEAVFPAHRRAEREAINSTDAAIRESTVPEELIAQAGKSAGHAALITQQREISYEQLHAMARGLAGALLERGAVADELIAVCVEKGWRQIVAVCGVLLSGAAYLPVDPSLPKERIHRDLQHGRVRLLVTASHLANELGDTGTDVVTLDPLLDAERDAGPSLPVSCTAEQLCYMLYTSGSTGEPKGVMIEHRSVTNRMADIAKRFALGPADRTIAITSLQHDLSVFDMFGPLLTGGGVVIPDQQSALDPAHWTELIGARRVTVWNSVPAFMDILVGYLESRSDAPDLGSLRLILLSGDRIPPKLYFRIRRAIPHAQVVSLGGPTEITVWDICHPLHDVALDIKRIPYGYPLANAKCYILDDELRDCPGWATGDLYSSGIGLARGYWDDEPLTRASFITHPRTGTRMYLTGDLGRYLPDGSIDIIGRRDFQVKVNGHRVECEEIEALLNKHPRVARSAVTTFQHAAGGQGLVAYVVPNGSDTPAKATPDAAGTQLGHLQFRLGQPGIRRFDGHREVVALRERGRADETETRQFLSRRSFRRFQARSLPRGDVAQLLGCLRQIRIDETPFPKYRYGSAGNLYPVQTYVYVRPQAIADVKGGVYYYHPVEDGLVPLGELEAFPVESVGPENRQLLEAASFVIFLIADLDAIRPLYANASLRYCAIEAGLMAQLLEMSCAGTQIGLTQIGGVQIDTLHEYFQLGPSHELIHALVGGSVIRDDTIDAYKREIVERPGTSMAQPVALPTELERYLESKLSRAVVPRRFVMLDALPLTRNGKVDRDALPAPQSLQRQDAVVYREPQTDIEKALVEIWQTVLGVERVGVQDNFFDLGGNSLLLIKANRLILERLRLEISIVEMFSHPTIQSMAGYLLSKSVPERAPVSVPEESARVQRRKNRGR